MGIVWQSIVVGLSLPNRLPHIMKVYCYVCLDWNTSFRTFELFSMEKTCKCGKKNLSHPLPLRLSPPVRGHVCLFSPSDPSLLSLPLPRLAWRPLAPLASAPSGGLPHRAQ